MTLIGKTNNRLEMFTKFRIRLYRSHIRGIQNPKLVRPIYLLFLRRGYDHIRYIRVVPY